MLGILSGPGALCGRSLRMLHQTWLIVGTENERGVGKGPLLSGRAGACDGLGGKNVLDRRQHFSPGVLYSCIVEEALDGACSVGMH